MTTLLARLTSFRTPRSVLLLLVLGLGLTTVARYRVGGSTGERTAEVAALDSAIRAATPVTEDTSAASFERLRVLVSKKRDIESRVQQQVRSSMFLLMGGSLLTLAAIVLGGVAFVSNLRDGQP